MSTFDGIISEFPDIRVDFFRYNPNHPRPLACFLSHVHSDHLAGLETPKAPFVYCSAGTREILLRLERYPCRINHARGVLEARVQTYKHLRNLLKPIPLETPTELELKPGVTIRVTLFDANHCPGAVMFLFESERSAVLYTGDLRSEPWFVSSIARNPNLVEYTSGIRTLDKIYLDTSFTGGLSFQTKAEGIAQLLQAVSKYPKDTIFHLQAWTFGYEDVWIALSKALKSRIHVDDYKMRIYSSLTTRLPENARPGPHLHMTPEAAALTGFTCGNTPHPGCLTRDTNVRLHSCEKGNYCEVVKKSPVVWISPIVARLPDGADLVEMGVGGGGDDLEREAELEHLTLEEMDVLMKIITEDDAVSVEVQDRIRESLLSKTVDGRNISLDLDMASFGDKNEMNLKRAVESMLRVSLLGKAVHRPRLGPASEGLPKRISFPYSRHSSYPELCHFLQAFRPRDVWPCTVNPREWLREGISIKSLLGEHCSGDIFLHDLKMEALASQMGIAGQSVSQTPETHESQLSISSRGGKAPIHPTQQGDAEQIATSMLKADGESVSKPIEISDDSGNRDSSQIQSKVSFQQEGETSRKRDFESFARPTSAQTSQDTTTSVSFSEISVPGSSPAPSRLRIDAYNAMMRNLAGDGSGGWEAIGLISTGHNHTHAEVELGEGYKT